MIDSFGTWNLIKLILEKLVCFFVFSMISAVLLIVNSGLEYCLDFYLLNAMKVSILLRMLLLLFLLLEYLGILAVSTVHYTMICAKDMMQLCVNRTRTFIFVVLILLVAFIRRFLVFPIVV